MTTDMARRPLYPREDLELLKSFEDLITVRGGSHCGVLYPIVVCEAACAAVSAKESYAGLMRGASSHDIPESLEKYHDAICRICTVMIRHYNFFTGRIWNREQRKITEFIPAVQKLFEDSGFTEKAEQAVGSRLPRDFFTVSLVTSVENGPEAIDISQDQDVFGIERSPLDAFYFIGHEFIIYLLFNALKEENAFKELRTWNLTEGLAEYYLKQVLGDTRFFNAQAEYVSFFEQANTAAPSDAATLYRKGLEAFG